ncbi:MAG: DUF2953 domain-containing protein, partial [Oscillibacter sp.]|nr:DUF2953 domain-containing protein [Oscillibacter sp.]
PALKRALRRLGRGVRIDPLDVSVVLGGSEEPADAAETYGNLQALVWTLMPWLERHLVIPHPHIHTDVDFTSARTDATFRLGISARVGALLMIGLILLLPVLRWYLAYRKKATNRKDDTNGNGKEEPAA